MELCDMISQDCNTCRKWQESRNKCFYDENNTLRAKISIFIHGCKRYRSWLTAEE